MAGCVRGVGKTTAYCIPPAQDCTMPAGELAYRRHSALCAWLHRREALMHSAGEPDVEGIISKERGRGREREREREEREVGGRESNGQEGERDIGRCS